jgi:hypothetical protein
MNLRPMSMEGPHLPRQGGPPQGDLEVHHLPARRLLGLPGTHARAADLGGPWGPLGPRGLAIL